MILREVEHLSRGRNYPAVKQRVAIDRQGTLCNKYIGVCQSFTIMLHGLIMCAQYIIGTDVHPEPESILIHLRNCSVEAISITYQSEVYIPWGFWCHSNWFSSNSTAG